MPNKLFLENYPLYSKFNLNISPRFIRSLEKPSIHMFCKTCGSEQTYNMDNEYYEVDYSQTETAQEQVLRLKYRCSGCGEDLRYFFIKLGCITKKNNRETNFELTAQKIGQYPSWDISTDKKLDELLGEHKDLYKKAIICESQGYGIGAFAYYRRIVENIIDELLESVVLLLNDEEKVKYNEVLEQTKKTHVALEKIELTKDLLPSSLRPDNINPLCVLHSSLSVGLHYEDEQECLEKAEAVKNSLLFLVEQLTRNFNESKKFTESMRKLLDGKAKK